MPCGLNHYDFSITSILFPAEDGCQGKTTNIPQPPLKIYHISL